MQYCHIKLQFLQEYIHEVGQDKNGFVQSVGLELQLLKIAQFIIFTLPSSAAQQLDKHGQDP